MYSERCIVNTQAGIKCPEITRPQIRWSKLKISHSNLSVVPTFEQCLSPFNSNRIKPGLNRKHQPGRVVFR